MSKQTELFQSPFTGMVKPRKKVLTYDYVAKELFLNENAYYIGNFALIGLWHSSTESDTAYPNICTSEKQAEKLIGINKLMNVAKYLNGEWKPNWEETSRKYYIKYSDINNEIYVDYSQTIHSSVAYFESEELAKQAIEILGEETIKLALSTDW